MIEPLNACDGLGDAINRGIAADLPEDVPALRVFYLYLSDGCNLHCRHCWITPRMVKGQPMPGECLDFKLLKLAIHEAKPLGLTAAKLTGGEPTLHPDFRRIVDYLTEENLDFTMETNGTLINRELAVHLSKTRLSHIAVSLDSPNPGDHDRFRGLTGAFNLTVRGINNLVEAGFSPQIIMSVYKENLNQVEELIEFAVSIGAGSVKFNPVSPSGRGAELHQKGLSLNFDDIIELTHRIRGPLQDRYPIYLCNMIPPALLTIKELLRHGGSEGICGVWHILGILGTGDMALCGIGRNIPELCFGRLGKDSIREVWIRNPTLVKLRLDLKASLPGICGDCLHAGRCLTHCVAMNYEMTGQLVNVAPLCAQAIERGMFPATRRISWDFGGNIRDAIN
ncbi:radical SAM protein [bacterium]|nr:radical SAM protein [candidate division CSSED10-310 bacterium]